MFSSFPGVDASKGYGSLAIRTEAETKARVPCWQNGQVPAFLDRHVVVPVTSELSSNMSHFVPRPFASIISAAGRYIGS